MGRWWIRDFANATQGECPRSRSRSARSRGGGEHRKRKDESATKRLMCGSVNLDAQVVACKRERCGGGSGDGGRSVAVECSVRLRDRFRVEHTGKLWPNQNASTSARLRGRTMRSACKCRAMSSWGPSRFVSGAVDNEPLTLVVESCLSYPCCMILRAQLKPHQRTPQR